MAVQQVANMTDPAIALETAFKAFNELSGELNRTWQALEDRVKQLTLELEAANDERLRELAARERIASRLSKLLQLLPGGVVVLNGQGRVAECNAAAIELLGSPLEGQLWLDIIRQRFAPRSDDGHEISLVNGKRVSLLSRSLDEEPGQIILITDQTETRRLQQRLSRHQRLLEMGKMVSSLAHQIRTPLSAAMLYAGHLGTMAANDDAVSDSRFVRTHERLMSQLHNMERQVRDMLTFARGETVLDQQMTLRQIFDETRLASEVLMRSGTLVCQWQEVSDDWQLLCNKESLIGALLNLLENAVQNGGPSVQLRVGTEIVEQSGDKALVRITVEDNGPGIAADKLEHVTEAFYTTRAQGTGLGLAVAQVVARAHGGQFFIQNRSDSNGSQVSGVCAGFVLPCNRCGSVTVTDEFDLSLTSQDIHAGEHNA